MTPLRDAYPPVGKPVRLWRDGRDIGVHTLIVAGTVTHYYAWQRLGRSPFPVHPYDAWETV